MAYLSEPSRQQSGSCADFGKLPLPRSRSTLDSMNDTHVVALIYSVRHRESVDYGEANPLAFENDHFNSARMPRASFAFDVLLPPFGGAALSIALRDGDVHAPMGGGLRHIHAEKIGRAKRDRAWRACRRDA